MFCMTCGSKLADNARFCTTCGTPVKVITPVQAQEIKENVTDAVVSDTVAAAEAAKEDISSVASETVSTVTEEVSDVKEDVYKAATDLKDDVAKVEAELESAVVERSSVDLDSSVDTSLDPDVLKALETPDIPDIKEEVKNTFDNAKESVKVEPVTPIIPVAPDNKIEVTPVIPIPDVAQPQVQPAPSMNSQTVQPAPSVNSQTVQPVAPVNNSFSQPDNGKPAKKEHEAFKFFAFIGAILSIVGCCLELHSFKDYPNGVPVDRVDKFYEYTEGIIIIAAMAVAIIFLIANT